MSTQLGNLFQIEAELEELLAFREETAAATDMTPAEQVESLAVIDNQIREYVTREVQKADGITAYLRECDTRAAVAKAEVKRIQAIAAAWERRGEQLEAVTMAVMQAIRKKRIDGASSSLAIKKCPPSCEVAQPDIVPPAYMKKTVTVTEDTLNRLYAHLIKNDAGAVLLAEFMAGKVSDSEPMKAPILAELKAGRSVPGCRLIDDKVRLEAK